jgi:hypothetical protein
LIALPLSLQDRTYTQPTHENASDDEEVAAGKKRVVEPDSEPSAERQVEAKAELASARSSVSKTPPPDPSTVRSLEEDEASYGFLHPAASRPQRTVWIPRDVLGGYVVEERECREAGVRVGHERADMDEKGRVGVSGGPPDLVGVVV